MAANIYEAFADPHNEILPYLWGEDAMLVGDQQRRMFTKEFLFAHPRLFFLTRPHNNRRS